MACANSHGHQPFEPIRRTSGPTDEELADIADIAYAAANIVIETLRNDGHLTDEGAETDRPGVLTQKNGIYRDPGRSNSTKEDLVSIAKDGV